MQIFDGQAARLDVAAPDSVESVRAKIQETEGVPASKQLLTFGGARLRPLSHYSIAERDHPR